METKKEKIISAVATIGIILTLFGATYAYFAAVKDTGKTTDVEVTANTVDVFYFETGDAISLSLDQVSFASGTGDKTASTFAKATLTPNNKTNTATDNYYVYLNITSNTFGYSLGSDKPEILLQVKDQSNATVTSLDGLTYSTITNGEGESVSGFDITTKTGVITLANNKEITANTNKKEETWNITIVYVNYDENQASNAGKSFSAKLMIQEEEEKITLVDWVKAQYAAQTSGSETIYLHNSSLTNGAGDNSYRYAGANPNNYVCFGSDATTCPDDNLYRIIGVFGNQVKLIKWDYATSALLGTDGDYSTTCASSTGCNIGFTYSTYKGSNVAANIGAYWWNNDGTTYGTNTWSASELNTVNLNTNFLTNIGSTWASKIATTTWKVGGNTLANIIESAINIAYQNEIVSPAVDTIENKKIGLMYVSDYGYAASPIYWKYPVFGGEEGESYDYRKAIGENWMYMGLHEWTTVRMSDSTTHAFAVNMTGYVGYSYVGGSFFDGVRPVFYLEPSVNYGSGDGTKISPVRLG